MSNNQEHTKLVENRRRSDEEIMRILANFLIDKFLENRKRLGLKLREKADNMGKANIEN